MLTINQRKILISFDKTTEAIKVLYNQLKKLEKNNQKDTEEFRKTIDYLNICLEVEESKYSNQTDGCDLEVIFENINAEKDFFEINQISDELDCRDRIKINIFNRITDINTKDLNEALDTIDEIGTDKIKESYNKITSILDMSKANNYEFNILFLSIIEDEIKENILSFTDKLIELKYNTIFYNKDIEKTAINNNFEIKPNAFIMINQEDELYQLGREAFANKSAIKTIGNMLSTDSEVIDFELYTNFCKLRASLAMLVGTEQFNILKENLEKMPQISLYNPIALMLAKEAFNLTITTKEKYRIMTLKI